MIWLTLKLDISISWHYLVDILNQNIIGLTFQTSGRYFWIWLTWKFDVLNKWLGIKFKIKNNEFHFRTWSRLKFDIVNNIVVNNKTSKSLESPRTWWIAVFIISQESFSPQQSQGCLSSTFILTPFGINRGQFRQFSPRMEVPSPSWLLVAWTRCSAARSWSWEEWSLGFCGKMSEWNICTREEVLPSTADSPSWSRMKNSDILLIRKCSPFVKKCRNKGSHPWKNLFYKKNYKPVTQRLTLLQYF